MTKENRLNRFICILLMTAVVLSCFIEAVPAFALTKAPTIDADYSIVMDVKTGTKVYDKNETKKMYPGGLTKIMTALVAMDRGDLSETNKSQIRSMLLEGSDDMANKLAADTYGTNKNFVKKMNDKAKKLGCKNTKFTNVSGNTNDKKQKTTMDDMAIVIRKFMKNKELMAMVDFEGKGKIQYGKLLVAEKEAKIKVSVALAKKGDSTFIAASSGGISSDACYEDNQKLLKYAFENYRTYYALKKGKKADKLKIKGGKKNYTAVYAKEDLCVTLPAEGEDELVKTKVILKEDVKAPLKANQVVGIIQALEAGEVTSQVEVIVKEDVAKGGPWSKIGISDYMMVMIVAIVIVLLITFFIIRAKIRRKKKKIAAMKKKRREAEAMRIARERAEKRRRNWPY